MASESPSAAANSTQIDGRNSLVPNGPPIIDMLVDFPEYNPYGYKPIFAMSIIGSVLMISLTLYLFFLYFKRRTWFFHMILVGASMECVGFVIRAANIRDMDSSWMFIIQFMLLVLAPSFLAAACYMAFGRLVWYVTPLKHLCIKSLWVPRRGITPIFVFFDLLSFGIQILGVGQVGGAQGKGMSQSQRDRLVKSGETTLKLGLVLQLLCFGIFALIGIRFLFISRRWGTAMGGGTVKDTRWQRLNWAINGAATLITLRAIYRIFDFSTGSVAQYLKTHEWVFWTCDAFPILVSLGLFCVFHPSYYLPHEFCRFRLNKKKTLKEKTSSETQIHTLGGRYMELGA